jgi:hypothetical protein
VFVATDAERRRGDASLEVLDLDDVLPGFAPAVDELLL